MNHNPENFPCISLQLVGIQTEIPILRIWVLPRLCAQPGDSVLLTMITANESHNVTPRSLCRAEHGFYHIISHPAPTFGVLEPGPCSISLPNIQLLTCWDHARVIRENILVISPHVLVHPKVLRYTRQSTTRMRDLKKHPPLPRMSKPYMYVVTI